MDLAQFVRTIPDFPKPGILFYDIAPLLADGDAWRTAIARMADDVAQMRPQVLAGIESRGFLMAAPMAAAMGLGFVMLRKTGKLPGAVIAHHYDLEYGSDTIEIQADMVTPGQRVVVVDDLLATGGTAAAAVDLLRRVGARVEGAAFLIELAALGGRARLDVPMRALLSFPG